MSEEPNPQPQDTIGDEFKKLGSGLAQVLKSAWERPERKAITEEIQQGMEELGRSLRQAANEVSSSDIGQKVKSEVDQLRSQVESGQAEETLRKDIQAILKRINQELENLAVKINTPVNKAETGPTPSAENADPTPGETPPPTE